MQSVRVVRLRLKQERAGAFESLAAEHLARVREAAPGVILDAIARRERTVPNWVHLLSEPLPNTTEYLHLAACADEDADHQLAVLERDLTSTLGEMLTLPPEVEKIQSPDFVTGISHEHVWTPDSIFRLTVYRMRIKPNEGELEQGALKMMQSVIEREPDPPVYTITRRKKGGSTLLPKGIDDREEYIRFHCYRQESGLAWHNELDKEWWGAFYPQFLDAPLEGQQFGGEHIIGGFSRDHVWGG